MDPRTSAAAFARGLLYVAAASCAGLLCALRVWLSGEGAREPEAHNIFWYLFQTYEPAAFGLLLGLCWWLRAWLRGENASGERSKLWSWWEQWLGQRGVVLSVAVCVFALAAAGWWTVYHEHPFSMDEYGAVFQARIFASGQLTARVPEHWVDLWRHITPIFVHYDPDEHTWYSAYLPVYAWLRSPFEAWNVGGLLNPLLAAVSVMLIAAIAGELWPSWKYARAVVALLLATSTQFLMTSMGAYSMPAHLAVNLFWLWLYMRATPSYWLVLPWLGFLAMGLHQFLPHALFAAPFLLRVVLQRRWRWSAYFGIVYLAGVAFWTTWSLQISYAGTPSSKVARFFGVPDLEQVFRTVMHLSLAFSWQSIGLGLLFVVGLSVRARSALVSDLKLSVALNWLGYLFFVINQGHGWGYRYVYPVLGNVVLIAALGAHWLAEEQRDVRALRVVALSVVSALCLQLPFRLFEVDHTVGPFARAYAEIQRHTEDAVLVTVDDAWYAQDFVRNDPLFRSGPIVIRNKSYARAIDKRMPSGKTLYKLSQDELAHYGLFVPAPRSKPQPQ